MFHLGGGGVGKSFLIRVVSRYVDKLMTKSGDNPMRPKLLLLGPTGKAASSVSYTHLTLPTTPYV